MANLIYQKKKINPLEFIFLIILIGCGTYFTYDINSTYSDLNKKILSSKKEESSNDDIIKQKDIYIRLQDYGYKLSAVDNLIKYKDSRVNWYDFLTDLKLDIPKNVTLTTQSYSEETGQLTTQIISPSEERLLEALQVIEEFKGLKNIDFNNVNKEKISFLGDKNKYEGFGTTFTAYIDEEYLNDKYEIIRNYKKLKYDIGDSENVIDLTNNIPLVTEGGVLEGTGIIDIYNENNIELNPSENNEPSDGYLENNLN